MLRFDAIDSNVADFKKRDSFYEIQHFINSKETGKILVLYGLRRTGKTTLLEQILLNRNPDEFEFYSATSKDSMEDVYKAIIDARKHDKTLFFIDEITKIKDFIEDSAFLSDVFSKYGMKIVISGTDSLGFKFAEENELYDRTIRVNTTHIPFSEHCRVLGTEDIDDYIEYGGLMHKGGDERIVHDYDSSCKQLDSAVSDNILNSIKNYPKYSLLRNFSYSELKAIIHKMVEIYSGSFNEKQIQGLLKKTNLDFALKKIVDFADEDIINELVLEKRNITKDFAEVINAGTKVNTVVTEDVIKELECYLFDMELLSVTTLVNYRKVEDVGWIEDKALHEFYIVQPAIKYHHLRKAQEFIHERPYYLKLTKEERNYMSVKLDEKIKGEMMEQIIMFDTKKILPKNKYEVLKPVFYFDSQRKGEYDMLIYDKEQNSYFAFEIKHTDTPFILQEKNLVNKDFREIVDHVYGDRIEACVIYRGKTMLSETGTLYVNVTDFALSIEKHLDVNMALNQLKELANELTEELANESTEELVKESTEELAKESTEEIKGIKKRTCKGIKKINLF